MVPQDFNPSTREAEEAYFEFDASLVYRVSSSLGYTEKPCLEKPKKKKCSIFFSKTGSYQITLGVMKLTL